MTRHHLTTTSHNLVHAAAAPCASSKSSKLVAHRTSASCRKGSIAHECILPSRQRKPSGGLRAATACCDRSRPTRAVATSFLPASADQVGISCTHPRQKASITANPDPHATPNLHSDRSTPIAPPPAGSFTAGFPTTAPVPAANPMMGRHPKSFTEGDIKSVSVFTVYSEMCSEAGSTKADIGWLTKLGASDRRVVHKPEVLRVGFAVGIRLNEHLCLRRLGLGGPPDALNMAIGRRKSRNVIHQSDPRLAIYARCLRAQMQGGGSVSGDGIGRPCL